MWHDVLTLSWHVLAADDAPPTDDPGSAIATVIAAVAGLITAVGGLVAAVALAWRRFRSDGDEEDPAAAGPDPEPPPGSGGRTRPVGQEVEESWVRWTQRQMVRLQEDRAASDLVARSSVQAAERAHEAEERAEQALAAFKLESERRERFLRRGLDPDTGDPLPHPTT